MWKEFFIDKWLFFMLIFDIIFAGDGDKLYFPPLIGVGDNFFMIVYSIIFAVHHIIHSFVFSILQELTKILVTVRLINGKVAVSTSNLIFSARCCRC